MVGVQSIPATHMPGPQKFFFEIPIYRCTFEAHTELIAREKDEYLRCIGADPITKPDSYANSVASFDKERWYSWRFNEVVGWLRLYRYGSQIRGELWFVRSKRLLPRGQKNYEYFGKAFELHFSPTDSDDQIATALLDELQKLQGTRQFKKRFIDLECFQTAALLIQWGKLLPSRERHV